MANILLVLSFAALSYVATQARSPMPRKFVEANDLSEKYKEYEVHRPLLNEILRNLDDTTADIDENNPLALRHVENKLRRMVEEVKQKRILICSVKPSERCDLDG